MREQATIWTTGYNRFVSRIYPEVKATSLPINDYSGIGAANQKLKEVEVGRVLLRIDILRESAMKERMVVVKAGEISSTIEKTGKIAIYGIFFDFDKAEIKPEPQPLSPKSPRC